MYKFSILCCLLVVAYCETRTTFLNEVDQFFSSPSLYDKPIIDPLSISPIDLSDETFGQQANRKKRLGKTHIVVFGNHPYPRHRGDRYISFNSFRYNRRCGGFRIFRFDDPIHCQ